MDIQKDTNKNEGEFLLSFVEEGIFNPDYKNYVGGRLEIHTSESPWTIDEMRFFTPASEEWFKFVELYDAECVDKVTLERIVKTIKGKFYQLH